jgi:menaquinone-dependent protoporphyrinogen oxidase
MPDKLLVAYATRHGSTAGVAKAIGEVLHEGDVEVDVRLAQDVSDLSPYRAVIVGSAIRMGRWLPEAVQFVEAHQEALSRLPMAYFLVCLTMCDDTEDSRRTVASYLDPVRSIVQPVDIGLFAGAVDYRKASLLLRLFMKLAKTPEGDFRRWDEIRAWAANLRQKLLVA